MPKFVCCFLGFLLVASVCGTALAKPTSAPATPPGGICPLTSDDVRAELVHDTITGRPGDELTIRIKMTPPEPPSGFYYASLVDVLTAPKKASPKILTGVPEIKVTCGRAGRYLFLVRVNLIAKSSCGGAKASTILEKKLVVIVQRAKPARNFLKTMKLVCNR